MINLTNIIEGKDFFTILWNLAIRMLEAIGEAWNWLAEDIKLEITWLKLPLILPNGVSINLGFSALELLGASLITLLIIWVVKALVPIF